MLLLFSFYATGQKAEDIFTICEVPIMASFPGGHSSLSSFISNRFVQPIAVPDSTFCKAGKVKFVIDKNGLACNFEIIEYLGYNCDEEIIRILKLTRWKPAVSKKQEVEEIKILPYNFMFEKSESSNSNTSPQSAPVCPSRMPLVKPV
jgi:hypothetical protein